MGTNDFKTVLSNSARRLAVLRYDNAADHRLLCADQEVKNFLPVNFPSADQDLDLDPTDELAERTSIHVVPLQGLSARLGSYSKSIMVSRQIVANDDVGLLGSMFAAIGTSAARTEARMTAELLSENPTLADGAPMFGTDNSVSEVLSASSLDTAMKLLRMQPTPAGNLANNRAYAIAVAAGLELTARTILYLAGLELAVVCLPWLDAGRWFLLADPQVAPIVGRLTLPGEQNSPPFIVGPGRTPKNYDGFVLAAVADLGVVALGRVGIVRGGA